MKFLVGIIAFILFFSVGTVVFAVMYNNGQYYQLGTAGSSAASYESINDGTNPRDHYVCNDGSLGRSYLIPNNTTTEWDAFKTATASLSDLETCTPIGDCNPDCSPSGSSGGSCPAGCSSSGSHSCLPEGSGTIVCSGPPYYHQEYTDDGTYGASQCGCGGTVCTGCGGGEDCYYVQTWSGGTCTDCCW